MRSHSSPRPSPMPNSAEPKRARHVRCGHSVTIRQVPVPGRFQTNHARPDVPEPVTETVVWCEVCRVVCDEASLSVPGPLCVVTG